MQSSAVSQKRILSKASFITSQWAQQRVHPCCNSLDEKARDYLPHMYGAANYAVIDDVERLPLKVSDIDRHLTSR